MLQNFLQWNIEQVRIISESLIDIVKLPKPKNKSKSKSYRNRLWQLKKNILISVFKLLGVILSLYMLYIIISPLSNLATSMFIFMWHDESPLAKGLFRAGFTMMAIILGVGAVLSIIDHVTGHRQVAAKPSEHDYHVLLRTVYEVLTQIAPVTRLYPMGYAESLKPDSWFRITHNHPIYIYSCPHKDVDLDLDKVIRIFNMELRRQQRESRISSADLAALVDLKIDRDYLHFDLILDAESDLAKKLVRDFKARRRGKGGSPDKDDDEF